jgi:signal transduction histidine kinase/CheY-like chemotaxis protein
VPEPSRVNVENLRESEYLFSRKTSVGALYIFALWCTMFTAVILISRPENIIVSLVTAAFFVVMAVYGILRPKHARETLSMIAYLCIPAFFFLIYVNGLPPTGIAPIVAVLILAVLPRDRRFILALIVSLAPSVVIFTQPDQVTPLYFRVLITSFAVTLLCGYFLHRYTQVNRELYLANQAKTDFLANMSHEIRTPLNSVFGSLQIIELNKSDEEIMEKHARVAMQSYQSVIGIVNDILDMTKIAEGKVSLHPAPNRLADLTGIVCSEFAEPARQKGIELEYQISDTAKEHNRLLDALRLTQVLRNLVSNAIKFTDQGKVVVTVDVGDEPDHVLIRVKDSGVGIAENKLAKIFDVFEQAEASRTTERRGTGLGLAITKKLVELMEGQINATSAVGEGTTFEVSVTLPVTDQAVDEKVTEELLDLKPARILLAEDMKANRLVFEAMLSDDLYQIDTAENGEEAVDMAMANDYDVIFMDIMMPRMGGIEALHSLKEAGYLSPIVACTANVMKEDVQKYMAEGFDGVIGKPFLRDDLRRKIQLVLDTGPV